MHPDRSEQVRAGPNRSEQVRTSPKTSKNVRKLQKNNEKFAKKIEKNSRTLVFLNSGWGVLEETDLCLLGGAVHFSAE